MCACDCVCVCAMLSETKTPAVGSPVGKACGRKMWARRRVIMSAGEIRRVILHNHTSKKTVGGERRRQHVICLLWYKIAPREGLEGSATVRLFVCLFDSMFVCPAREQMKRLDFRAISSVSCIRLRLDRHTWGLAQFCHVRPGCSLTCVLHHEGHWNTNTQKLQGENWSSLWQYSDGLTVRSTNGWFWPSVSVIFILLLFTQTKIWLF